MTATCYDNVRAFIGIPYLTSNSSADISLLVSTKQAKINIFPRTTISPQDFYNGKIPPEQVYSVSYDPRLTSIEIELKVSRGDSAIATITNGIFASNNFPYIQYSDLNWILKTLNPREFNFFFDNAFHRSNGQNLLSKLEKVVN